MHWRCFNDLPLGLVSLFLGTQSRNEKSSSNPPHNACRESFPPSLVLHYSILRNQISFRTSILLYHPCVRMYHQSHSYDHDPPVAITHSSQLEYLLHRFLRKDSIHLHSLLHTWGIAYTNQWTPMLVCAWKPKKKEPSTPLLRNFVTHLCLRNRMSHCALHNRCHQSQTTISAGFRFPLRSQKLEQSSWSLGGEMETAWCSS